MSSFTYTYTRSHRIRSIRITVHHDGSVKVSSPIWVASTTVDRFVQEKRDWIERKIIQFRKAGPKSIIYYNKKDKKTYVEQARIYVLERLGYFNKFYGYTIGTVHIRDQKSRWGSCSKKGNLNFNYKLALLPKKLADYIVVHELCHIGQFDHSRKFWDLVARNVPDYKECRKELKRIKFLAK